METSLKVSAAVLFALLAGGTAIVEGSIWHEAQSKLMDKQTHYDERRIDVNSYLHGRRFPTITVENQQLAQHDSYDPYDWVQVYDEQDGNLTAHVKVYGEVDTTKVGIYELRYEIINSLGLKSSKRIKVKVG